MLQFGSTHLSYIHWSSFGIFPYMYRLSLFFDFAKNLESLATTIIYLKSVYKSLQYK
jgi:hypothetical protein